nr:sulfotransferase [Salinibacter ruber]
MANYSRSKPSGITATTQGIKARVGRWSRYVAGRFVSVQDNPVFVLGNQKSGTTVIAAGLAHCAGVSATLDLRDLTADLLTGVYDGRVSVGGFINRYRLSFSRRLIKEPNLTFLYGALAEHFPKAQFLLIVRDPRDNLRSFLNGFHVPGHLEALGPEHQQALNPVWRAIVFNHGLGIAGENYVDGLARRWNRAADVYLNHPENVQLVRYEDFCSDKTGTIKTLVRALNLEVRHDPSSIVEQQHQGRGNRSVEWNEFFGGSNLNRIEARCASRMKALGYV